MTSPTKAEREASLEAQLERLHGALNGFPIVLEHGLPDHVLVAFGYDTWEQAGATLLVARGPSPRAAVVNARAAFEASLDMYTLTAEPSSYDEMGAFARVCEVLALEDIRRLKGAASATAGATIASIESVSPEDAVREEGRDWETHNKGIAITFARVLNQARQEGRWRRHWSGLGNYREVAEYVARKHGAPPGFAEIVRFFYRALTHESHPGLRTGSRSLGHDTPGRLTYGPKAGGEAFPLLVATVSCEHAIDALRLRRELFPTRKPAEIAGLSANTEHQAE